MLELLSYPPVMRGLVLLLISGGAFPLAGVFILRMNLLSIRFLLMHGVLLGGALALVLRINPSATSLVVNILLVLLLSLSRRRMGGEYGSLTLFLMVASVAAASILISVFRVPAKDTLTLLWGSLYSSTPLSIAAALITAVGLILFCIFFFRQLISLFMDRSVARSLGVSVENLELVLMILIAIVVALAMGLMGALLLDALILLPALIAGWISSSLKKMMLFSCFLGFLFALSGFFISLQWNLPLSAAVAGPAIVLFIIIVLFKKGVINDKSHS